jgi:hypothetical protein
MAASLAIWHRNTAMEEADKAHRQREQEALQGKTDIDGEF